MKKIIFFCFCISIFCLVKCAEEGESNKTRIKNNWELGREQFINNCAYCHVPQKKDEEFVSYVENKSRQTLQVILKDSVHHVLKQELLDSLDLKAIEAYIFHKTIPKNVE